MHEYKLAAWQESDISSFAAIGLRACFCGRIKDLIIVDDDVNYYPQDIRHVGGSQQSSPELSGMSPGMIPEMIRGAHACWQNIRLIII
jgi:hypothetical protein